MNSTILAMLSTNGGPALAGFLVLAALGVPFVPATLLLLATGALAADLGFSLPVMMSWALAASVTGDQLGYWIGRLAGTPIHRWASSKPMLARELKKAETMMQTRGTYGVFLTRWLITPAGPYINVVAGILKFPWWKFTLAGVFGEALWVTIYIQGGLLAGGSIEEIASMAGDVTWVIATGVAMAVLARQLFKKPKNINVVTA